MIAVDLFLSMSLDQDVESAGIINQGFRSMLGLEFLREVSVEVDKHTYSCKRNTIHRAHVLELDDPGTRR